MKWQFYAPTVTSIDSTNYPIWNIYFPAITVCSNNKIVSKQFRAVLKQPPWKNISEDSEDEETFKRDLYNAVKIMILFQVFTIPYKIVFMSNTLIFFTGRTEIAAGAFKQ